MALSNSFGFGGVNACLLAQLCGLSRLRQGGDSLLLNLLLGDGIGFERSLGSFPNRLNPRRLHVLGRQRIYVRVCGVEEGFENVDVRADQVGVHLEAGIATGITPVLGVLNPRFLVVFAGLANFVSPRGNVGVFLRFLGAVGGVNALVQGGVVVHLRSYR